MDRVPGVVDAVFGETSGDNGSDVAMLVSQVHDAHATAVFEAGQDFSGLFQFVPGPLLRCMTSGEWLLLDCADLARPEVLERLNSVGEERSRLYVKRGATCAPPPPPHAHGRRAVLAFVYECVCTISRHTCALVPLRCSPQGRPQLHACRAQSMPANRASPCALPHSLSATASRQARGTTSSPILCSGSSSPLTRTGLAATACLQRFRVVASRWLPTASKRRASPEAAAGATRSWREQDTLYQRLHEPLSYTLAPASVDWAGACCPTSNSRPATCSGR